MKSLLALALTLTLAATTGAGALHDGPLGPRDAGATGTPAPARPAAPAATPGDERRAAAVLAELTARYRHLDGVTVSFGPTPAGHQAVAYPAEGRIVISPERIATIRDILEHEIWHVIDWRADGRIDWGEQVPPTGAEAFER